MHFLIFSSSLTPSLPPDPTISDSDYPFSYFYKYENTEHGSYLSELNCVYAHSGPSDGSKLD